MNIILYYQVIPQLFILAFFVENDFDFIYFIFITIVHLSFLPVEMSHNSEPIQHHSSLDLSLPLFPFLCLSISVCLSSFSLFRKMQIKSRIKPTTQT